MDPTELSIEIAVVRQQRNEALDAFAKLAVKMELLTREVISLKDAKPKPKSKK